MNLLKEIWAGSFFFIFYSKYNLLKQFERQGIHMAIPIKAMLLKENDPLGHGINAYRKYKDDPDKVVDISNYDDYCSDSTSPNNRLIIIKNNIPYACVKNYFDLDTTTRVYVCVECLADSDIVT
jgi:hypothetical protein